MNGLHHVRGFVMTSARQPLAGAEVQLAIADDPIDDEVRTTKTGEDGSFVFPSVSDGNFVLQGGTPRNKIPSTPIIVSAQDITDLKLVAKPPD